MKYADQEKKTKIIKIFVLKTTYKNVALWNRFKETITNTPRVSKVQILNVPWLGKVWWV